MRQRAGHPLREQCWQQRQEQQRQGLPLPRPAAAAWCWHRQLQLGHSRLLRRLPHCRRMIACCRQPAPQPGPVRPPLALPGLQRLPLQLLHSAAAAPVGLRPQPQRQQQPAAAEGNTTQPQAERRRWRRVLEAADSTLLRRQRPPAAMWAADGPRTGPWCCRERSSVAGRAWWRSSARYCCNWIAQPARDR